MCPRVLVDADMCPRPYGPPSLVAARDTCPVALAPCPSKYGHVSVALWRPSHTRVPVALAPCASAREHVSVALLVIIRGSREVTDKETRVSMSRWMQTHVRVPEFGPLLHWPRGTCVYVGLVAVDPGVYASSLALAAENLCQDTINSMPSEKKTRNIWVYAPLCYNHKKSNVPCIIVL